MAKRAKIAVSDLHVGAGRVVDGNVLEDFTVDETFSAFLQELVEESQSGHVEMELIIAGDGFEYLQVPHVGEFDPSREYPADSYRSSSASDSAQKTRHMVEGHPLFFQALRAFMSPADPRRWVTIVKGNHDVNLHWRSAQRVLQEAVDATGPRGECLAFEERRVRRERIWVEHGNQQADVVNRFDDFEEPHDPERVGQLAMPVGSRFVMGFFNGVERERYWVDGVKPVTSLIWYLLALDFPFALRALLALFRETPWLAWAHPPWGGMDVDAETALSAVADDEARANSLALQFQDNEAFRKRFLTWVRGGAGSARLVG